MRALHTVKRPSPCGARFGVRYGVRRCAGRTQAQEEALLPREPLVTRPQAAPRRTRLFLFWLLRRRGGHLLDDLLADVTKLARQTQDSSLASWRTLARCSGG